MSSVGKKCNGLYLFSFHVICKKNVALAAQSEAPAFNLDLGKANYVDKPFCEPCVIGKQIAKSHKPTVVRTNFAPGEWIYTGGYRVQSFAMLNSCAPVRNFREISAF